MSSGLSKVLVRRLFGCMKPDEESLTAPGNEARFHALNPSLNSENFDIGKLFVFQQMAYLTLLSEHSFVFGGSWVFRVTPDGSGGAFRKLMDELNTRYPTMTFLFDLGLSWLAFSMRPKNLGTVRGNEPIQPVDSSQLRWLVVNPIPSGSITA
ncbi:hypothetical protein ARMSODRAFT_978673 [Armillaria solidipes]|uniref:Uncharacterized protein n=1 Tax=Armillaria solidipes TaxID=1076256 RepID=A0A2H3B295_9AGAR|nr:hypothetical protein ARMSODRAFT_978673 [Armillaria solidipes]